MGFNVIINFPLTRVYWKVTTDFLYTTIGPDVISNVRAIIIINFPFGRNESTNSFLEYY